MVLHTSRSLSRNTRNSSYISSFFFQQSPPRYRNRSRSHSRSHTYLRHLLQIQPVVAEALASCKPVAALESTIIAHGMPYPQNMEVALEVEDILRSKDVTPATIAAHQSKCFIGLSMDQIKDLALSGSQNQCAKLTTRDLPLFLASSLHPQPPKSPQPPQPLQPLQPHSKWGATTVASTMHLSYLAGIQTFITGGTGGVHRGVESTMDISADLTELGRTPVIVVSAGIKSILDISKTLEVLETLSVPITVYRSNHMPAFYSGSATATNTTNTNGADADADAAWIPSPSVVHCPSQIAQMYWTMRGLNLQSGMMVAVPYYSGKGEQVERAIQLVLKEIQEFNVSGHKVTPYILKRVAEVTDGESLKSNIELVKQNAEIGADIAIEVAKQKQILHNGPQTFPIKGSFHNGTTTTGTTTGTTGTTGTTTQKTSKPTRALTHNHPNTNMTNNKGKVIVMGGAVFDIIAKPAQNQKLIPSTSNPGHFMESEGGVGRNIAEVLGRLGASPLFFTAVGNDERGKRILTHLQDQCCVNHNSENDKDSDSDNNDSTTTHHFASTVSIVDTENTATYLAVLNGDGDLFTAVADMKVLSHIPLPLHTHWEEGVQYFILDGNPPLHSMIQAAQTANQFHVKVFWDPTSIPKAIIGAHSSKFLSYLTYASPNEDELLAMADSAGWIRSNHNNYDTTIQGGTKNTHCDDFIKDAARYILQKMNTKENVHLIITRGENGVLLGTKYKRENPLNLHTNDPFEFTSFTIQGKPVVQNCTGAGDTLSGAFVYALLKGMDEKMAVRMGMKAAALSVECAESAISPLLDNFKFSSIDQDTSGSS